MRTCLALVLFMVVASAVSPAADDGASVEQGVTVILYGGVVVPMALEAERYEAIAVAGDSIVALGSDEEILALASSDTTLVDLAGRAVYPGFIDFHTHVMKAAYWSRAWDAAQEYVLQYGVTTIGEMFADPEFSAALVEYAASGGLRLRVFPYFTYTDSCGSVLGAWYEKYSPEGELAPLLRVGGVKTFAELSVCGPTALRPVFSTALQTSFPANAPEDWRTNQLVLSEEELTAVIQRAQDKGYQVAVHAIGDKGIETTIRAIATVLRGGPNTMRHTILHNWVLRDDMLPLYAQHGILASVEPNSSCSSAGFAEYSGRENLRHFKRWRELLAAGAHVILHSDSSQSSELWSLNPLKRIGEAIGQTSTDPFQSWVVSCPELISDEWFTPWQALRAMTLDAAYALRMEDELGTLEPGKLADLAVLSADPLATPPSEIEDIQVLMTMVNGRVEYDPTSLFAARAISQPQRAQSPTEAESRTAPLVLFDEYHAERNTISPDRAVSLNPSHPEWVLYRDLLVPLASKYQIAGNVGPLTDEALSPAAVLVVAAPDRLLSESEHLAVVDFVRSGGGLLLLGDCWPSEATSEVGRPFGVGFARGALLSHSGTCDQGSDIALDVNTTHPITTQGLPFETNWATAIELTAPGSVLVQSPGDTWLDANDNGKPDATEKVGPFVLAVALEFGAGRVVAFSDNAFHDSWWEVAGNRAAFLGAVDWLAGELPGP